MAPTVSYTLGTDIISQATHAPSSTNHSPSFLLYDGHGSTRLLTDSSGSITDRMNYDAYGMMLGLNPTSSAPPTTSLLYSGEQFDVDLQKQYLRARYYDQSIGAFNRLDPFVGDQFEPLSLHKYIYAHDDPANGIDPNGKQLLNLLIGSSISQSISTIYNESVLTIGFGLQASLEGIQAGKTAERIYIESVLWGAGGIVAVRALSLGAKVLSNVTKRLIKKFRSIRAPTAELGETVARNVPFTQDPYIYRSITQSDPNYAQFSIVGSKGTIKPNGGHNDLYLHVNQDNTNSIFTSWSKDEGANWLYFGISNPGAIQVRVDTRKLENIAIDVEDISAFPWEKEVTVIDDIIGIVERIR